MHAILFVAFFLVSVPAMASEASLISCGVSIAIKEILSEKSDRSMAIERAWQRCKTQAPQNIGITEFGNAVGNELDKADDVVSAETFDQPRDNITTGEVYLFNRDIPPTFNVDLRCRLFANIQNRNQCIQEEQGAYDALKYSWLTIDKRAKIKCSREMWHFAGRHVGEIYPSMPYRMYLSCVAPWDDYFKNNAPDSAVKKFRQ